MFNGRGKRNMRANWREPGGVNIVASLATPPDDNSDGGAPLRTPVLAGPGRSSRPGSSTATKHQATAVSDSDSDSTDDTPLTLHKISDWRKHKIKVKNAKVGNNDASTQSQNTYKAPATHHLHGTENDVTSLNGDNINEKVDHKGEGKTSTQHRDTDVTLNTHTPLNNRPQLNVSPNTAAGQSTSTIVRQILPMQHVVTARSKLSPVAETFVPRGLVTQHSELDIGKDDPIAQSDAAYDLLMKKLSQKYPLDNQPLTTNGSSIPHSFTVYDGLGQAPIQRFHSPRLASQVPQSQMHNSVSMGSGLDHQPLAGHSLRTSRTEPINKDPHSVSAILNDDSAYESNVTTPGGMFSHMSNTIAGTPRAFQQQVYAHNDQSHNPVYQQVPGSNGLALNAANYRASIAPQDSEQVAEPRKQDVGDSLSSMGSNVQSVPYTHVYSQTHPPTDPRIANSGQELAPSTRQLSPGQFDATAQTWTPRLQDLLPLRLEGPSERLFQPPTAEEIASRSHELNELIGRHGLPSAVTMLDPRKVPFTENCTLLVRNKKAGVLKIKNTPFNVLRNEVLAIFGRQGKILNDNEEPIHIILEKVSAKTQDAYAEFETENDARKAYARIQENIARGRVPRIGSRQVVIEFSSQSALMQELFPVAHGVTWDNANPVIRTDSPYPIDNFKCFTSEEECTQICRHFECPGRSPFSRDCPERFIESMISTLKKLPWHMSDYVTIHQQSYVYDSCQKLLEVLLDELDPNVLTRKAERQKRLGHERLTPQLLRRFINAIMLCPGFSVVQKDNIASMANMSDLDMRNFNMPRNAQSWNHLYALGPKPGVPTDFLEYYISVLRQESNRAVANLPIHMRRRLAELADATDNQYFGYFWREVNWPNGETMDNTTLREAAVREWSAIEHVIRRALTTGPDRDNDSPDDRPQPVDITGPSCAGLLVC